MKERIVELYKKLINTFNSSKDNKTNCKMTKDIDFKNEIIIIKIEEQHYCITSLKVIRKVINEELTLNDTDNNKYFLKKQLERKVQVYHLLNDIKEESIYKEYSKYNEATPLGNFISYEDCQDFIDKNRENLLKYFDIK